MKASSQELLQILKSGQEAGGPRSTIAVVSPCSRCKNQRITPEAGLPACPRRHWDEFLKEAQDSAAAPPPDYLVRHNKAGTGDRLENPVYIKDLNIILVWIAAVEENRDIQDSSGNLVNPSILNMDVSGSGTGAFDTNYITCQHYPCVPGLHSTLFFHGGQLSEGERLVITQSKVQQLHAKDGSPVAISGFAQRASPLYDTSVDRPARDVNQRGT